MRKNMKENRWKGCLVGRGRGGGEKMVRPSFFLSAPRLNLSKIRRK